MISLDFELHWGVRDVYPANHPYRANLVNARTAILRLLEVFRERRIAATWATVGFLFARGAAEKERFSPRRRPAYNDFRLDPYQEPAGTSEQADPIHFAPEIIREIRECPGQEIATHTFSHYYCLEPGQDRESFRADLASAIEVARARGVSLRSLVFPRNQVNPGYTDIVVESGILCYRGNPAHRLFAPAGGTDSRLTRACRLIDSHVPLTGAQSYPWGSVRERSGLCNVPASLFLRPVTREFDLLMPLRLRRIAVEMHRAASTGQIFHLWWHPHNFGAYLEENLTFLGRVLDEFEKCRSEWGMRSMSMIEVAEEACAE